LSEHGYHRQAETITRTLLLGENLSKLSTLILCSAVVSEDVLRDFLVDCKGNLRSITLYRVKMACPKSEWSGILGTFLDLPSLWSLYLDNITLKGSRRPGLVVSFKSIKRFDEANGQSGHNRVSMRGRDVVVAGLRELLSIPLDYFRSY
jgi:hypothetical protein